MTDEINVDEVMRKSTELEEASRNFQVAHEVFHCRVENYASVPNQVEQLEVNVNIWLMAIMAIMAGGHVRVAP